MDIEQQLKVRHEILQKRFDEFVKFIEYEDKQTFISFSTSKYFDKAERYKEKIFKEARETINNAKWKQEEIGKGKIHNTVGKAIKAKVIYKYLSYSNNLINNWRLKENFTKFKPSIEFEKLLFDFYKSKGVKDEFVFEELLKYGQPYNLIAYLFFIKNSEAFLPISQQKFDEIFELIGLPNFKTSGNSSWENYKTFLDIIKQVRTFLRTKDSHTTLLDAHSFLWIIGNQMREKVSISTSISQSTPENKEPIVATQSQADSVITDDEDQLVNLLSNRNANSINYTGYWTFFCNPKKWEIDKFLESGKLYDTYQTTDWQREHFQPGQLAIIRVGIDTRTKRELEGRPKLVSGVYAIVEILSIAKIRGNEPDKFWREWTDKELEKPIVEIRYLKNLIHSPLLLESIKSDNDIQKDKYLLSGFQASSMPLEKSTFERIIQLTGNEEQIFENIEPVFADNENEIILLEEKYKYASPQVKEVISKRIERGKIAQAIKIINGYKCKLCEAIGNNPFAFKKTNGEYYVETHHIIPVSHLKQGSLGISNLITVCANHHRQLHYGDIRIIDNTKESLTLKIDGKEIITKKVKPSTCN